MPVGAFLRDLWSRSYHPKMPPVRVSTQGQLVRVYESFGSLQRVFNSSVLQCLLPRRTESEAKQCSVNVKNDQERFLAKMLVFSLPATSARSEPYMGEALRQEMDGLVPDTFLLTHCNAGGAFSLGSRSSKRQSWISLTTTPCVQGFE